jgi:putative SOS response-associated peptidase YedK
MCGRFALKSIPKALIEVFGLEPPEAEPRPDIRPSEAAAVLLREAKTGQPGFRSLSWGLVLARSGLASKPVRVINARAETLSKKPAFREAFRHRRCLVPASGFYEWRREGRRRLPFLFAPADPAAPLVLAGIWEEGAEGSGRPGSFAIITTAANAEVRPVHDRMPVILPPSAWKDWLDPEVWEYEGLAKWLGPAKDGFFQAEALPRFDGKTDTRERSLFPAD